MSWSAPACHHAAIFHDVWRMHSWNMQWLATGCIAKVPVTISVIEGWCVQGLEEYYLNAQGCILQHEHFPIHIPVMLPEKSFQWCKCKTKTNEMISCVLTCWDMLMTLAGLEGKLEKGTDSLITLVRALQDRAPRTQLLCACVSRSSRSSLAFIGRMAVST